MDYDHKAAILDFVKNNYRGTDIAKAPFVDERGIFNPPSSETPWDMVAENGLTARVEVDRGQLFSIGFSYELISERVKCIEVAGALHRKDKRPDFNDIRNYSFVKGRLYLPTGTCEDQIRGGITNHWTQGEDIKFNSEGFVDNRYIHNNGSSPENALFAMLALHSFVERYSTSSGQTNVARIAARELLKEIREFDLAKLCEK
ncbi:hypothetical protein HOC01_05100 [archaeon]|jgi:hypothetical protein|nr:hypothetical protein [archaeon]MBT6698187.1 hypothetical protein [archaeon]